MVTFIRYIGVDSTFGLLDCVRYNEDFVISRFVISRFCSIHFIVTLVRLKNIVRYTEDFVIEYKNCCKLLKTTPHFTLALD